MNTLDYSLQFLDRVQNGLCSLAENYSPLCSQFPTDSMLQAYQYYHYFHGEGADEIHSSIPSVRTFTIMKCHVTFRGELSLFPLYTKCKKGSFTWIAFAKKMLLWGKDLYVISFLGHFNLNFFISRVNHHFSSLSAIFTSYCFLFHSYDTTSFSINILTVNL